MGKTKRSCEEVKEAIEGSGGVKTLIAERLNVSRWTVDRYLDRWVTAKRIYDDEVAGISDLARSIVIDNLRLQRQRQQKEQKPVDTKDALWWLRMKESDEFSDKTRQEITGAEGEPLTIEYINDWRKGYDE